MAPAPLSIKIRTVSTCPATLARARAVQLLSLRCSRLAPRSNKNPTNLQCPFRQATRRGVDPWQSQRSTWQHRSNNSWTTSVFPFLLANESFLLCSGVESSCLCPTRVSQRWSGPSCRPRREECLHSWPQCSSGHIAPTRI
jgi:hypothetical protein